MALPASSGEREKTPGMLREELEKRVDTDAALRKVVAATEGTRARPGTAGQCLAGERAQLRRADATVVADIA